MSSSDAILQAWTAAWRRTCLQGRLAAYLGRTKDKSKQKWLDDWMAKSSHPAPHNLSSLLDSTEDWKRLRGCGYGTIPFLSSATWAPRDILSFKARRSSNAASRNGEEDIQS